MMSDYAFYANILRFVVKKTPQTELRVGQMMGCLELAAQSILEHGSYCIVQEQYDIYAKALAGVAGFLQQHILPETIADQNKEAEMQIRWVVDRSMEAVNQIMQAKALNTLDKITIIFPPPPAGSS